MFSTALARKCPFVNGLIMLTVLKGKPMCHSSHQDIQDAEEYFTISRFSIANLETHKELKILEIWLFA